MAGYMGRAPELAKLPFTFAAGELSTRGQLGSRERDVARTAAKQAWEGQVLQGPEQGSCLPPLPLAEVTSENFNKEGFLSTRGLTHGFWANESMLVRAPDYGVGLQVDCKRPTAFLQSGENAGWVGSPSFLGAACLDLQACGWGLGLFVPCAQFVFSERYSWSRFDILSSMYVRSLEQQPQPPWFCPHNIPVG